MTNLEAENQRFRTELEERDEQIDRLEARLRRNENPHTPTSKRRSTSAGNEDDEGNGDARTDGGTIGRNPGHDLPGGHCRSLTRLSKSQPTAVRIAATI
ncbi:hypothetical protein JCM31271_31610 [Halorubrum trueperi]